MIKDRRMEHILSESGMDYYVFTPSLFRQYYNKTEEWTSHRGSFSHKLHMFLYYIRGGYRVLYMTDGDSIASYIVFTECGNSVIRGTTKKDLFTIFVTTHPDHRRRGLASCLVKVMLEKFGKEYENSYKTIYGGNEGSKKAALANGYEACGYAEKSRLLKTIVPVEKSDLELFRKRLSKE